MVESGSDECGESGLRAVLLAGGGGMSEQENKAVRFKRAQYVAEEATRGEHGGKRK